MLRANYQQLGKLTECIWINNLSILLTIKLYTFIFFAVCGDGLEMVTTNEVSTCVCAADYYQTAAAIIRLLQPLMLYLLSAQPVHLEAHPQ